MANNHQGEISSDVELLAADEPISKDPEVDKDVALLEEEPEVEEVESDDEPEIEAEVTDELEESEEKPDDSKFPYDRPTVTDVNKSFPDFFKKFPAMKDVLFREKEFTTLFPTIEIAKDAQEAAEALQSFREDLFTGDSVKFTSALKEEGQLDKFSKNFLVNLQKTDKDIYWETIAPTLQNLVRSFHKEGVNRKDDNIRLSAENLSIYLFGNAEVAEGKQDAVKPEAKPDPKIAQERSDWERDKYNNFRIDVLGNINKDVKEVADLGKVGLSKTVKELLTDKLIKEVDSTIAKDETHMKYVNSLWKKAKESGYTNEIKSSIISAYLERAKSLVPSIRRRLIAEALGSSPEESKRKLEVSARAQSRREPGSNGRPANGNAVKVASAKAIDWNKTSDMDFLNDNTTLKGRK